MSAPVSFSSVSSTALTISSILISRKAFSLVLTMSIEVFFYSSTLAQLSYMIILFSTLVLVGHILVLFLVTKFSPVKDTLSEEADEGGGWDDQHSPGHLGQEHSSVFFLPQSMNQDL